MRAQQARKPYTYIQFSLGQRERVLLVSKSIQGERNQTVEEIYLPATMQHPFVANRGEKFAFFAIFSLVRCSFFFSKCFFPFLSYFSFFSFSFLFLERSTILWLPELKNYHRQGRFRRLRGGLSITGKKNSIVEEN